jgi:hypothetical protein
MPDGHYQIMQDARRSERENAVRLALKAIPHADRLRVIKESLIKIADQEHAEELKKVFDRLSTEEQQRLLSDKVPDADKWRQLQIHQILEELKAELPES